MDRLIVRDFSSELLQDFLDFFEREAFSDNPGWADCYCMYYHFTGTEREWQGRSGLENRVSLTKLARSGLAHGILAYVGDRPVGWCNAAKRPVYHRLNRSPQLWVNDAEKIGSIVCFLVSPSFRLRGIANILLDAACTKFTLEGLKFAEAYPRKTAESPRENCEGPLSMYRGAGFTPFRELEFNVVMRKALSPT